MIKKGKQGGKQRYKCLICGKQFQSKARPQKRVSSIWHQFDWERKPIKQLCKEHKRGKGWVRKQLKNAVVDVVPVFPCKTVIVADTTWFKRDFKVCVVRSSHIGRNLFWLETDRENAAVYRQVKEARL